jgi:hypothetical protein
VNLHKIFFKPVFYISFSPRSLQVLFPSNRILLIQTSFPVNQPQRNSFTSRPYFTVFMFFESSSYIISISNIKIVVFFRLQDIYIIKSVHMIISRGLPREIDCFSTFIIPSYFDFISPLILTKQRQLTILYNQTAIPIPYLHLTFLKYFCRIVSLEALY